MPSYLVALAIGPVQDFIAAARRSRDLWFGSYLLSEVSKAAALALREQNATLVFPAPQDPQDLQPGSDLNVANKLLAEVDTGDPAALLRTVKAAALARWDELAQESLKELKKTTRHRYQLEFHVRQDAWDSQVGGVLELFAAWVPLGDDYSQARKRVDELLAARKNTRDFLPAPGNGYGIPKSSLDGRRESVLPEAEKLPKWVKRKLGLNEGEQLDCPGVVKRLGGQDLAEKRFTSIARIALDPWLRQIPEAELAGVCVAFETLVDDGLATRVGGNEGIYAALPYDGQLLYPFRLEAARPRLKKERPENPVDCDGALARLDALEAAAQPLRKYGEPNPYVAVLLADGDRMGKMLNELLDADHHRQASQALSRFAQAVPGIVREHRGHCIYAGGDDVLAFVPLDTVLCCARRLHDRFAVDLKLDFAATQPTLSVGIGVGHWLEPMGKLLDLARKAEKLAKGKAEERDGLAVILEPRSGAPVQMRGCWKDDPDLRLGQWMQAFKNDAIPDKAAYELRELAREMHWAPRSLLGKEMHRVLTRKRAGAGTCPIDDPLIKELTAAAGLDENADATAGFDLSGLVAEMLIARRLCQTTA